MQDEKTISSILEQADHLYSLNEIYAALDKMATEINHVYQGKNPVILCVMTGALITVGHLVMRLDFPLEIDYIHATRYRGTLRGGDLHWLVEPRISLKNRHVLIVDDIMDGGLTLAAIIDFCKQSNAASVSSAVLVSKNRKREKGVHFEPEFVGLNTEDKYLFGFGLDYEEYLRNAPGIYAVKS